MVYTNCFIDSKGAAAVEAYNLDHGKPIRAAHKDDVAGIAWGHRRRPGGRAHPTGSGSTRTDLPEGERDSGVLGRDVRCVPGHRIASDHDDDTHLGQASQGLRPRSRGSLQGDNLAGRRQSDAVLVMEGRP